ncbi:hypothetical protein [Fibrella forsythiae]|uniref:Uncharacterized protein n=1 Tax=Fibrella forsythiae TaxID=2817061 RepID=A0ABS3JBX3_9BACT|nr:hypothetical protein [Fibrella forsythiae]MBO0947482.1 hypothetical protein [Fibrella forsythiae]
MTNETTPYRYQFTSRTIGNMEVAKIVADGLVGSNGAGAAASGYFGSGNGLILFGVLVILFGALRMGLSAVIQRSKAIDPIE